MKKSVLWSLLVLSLSTWLPAQLTIRITSIPSGTPPGADIYVAGNFNSWNPGHAAYQMQDQQDGTYSITFQPNPGQLQYKFTRGSWDTVEGNAAGGFIPNRTYTYTGGEATIEVTIAGWEGGSGGHTAADNVYILDETFYIPQLNRYRRVWIYLPPDYDTTAKRYPVVYMQDGQNLFDAYYSFAGEWKVDESMNDLFDHGDYGAIIVGIDNGGAQRIHEYSPWVNSQYGGGDGEAYAAFVAETLKPYVDQHYRTLPEREYTAIAGSSLGANIALYISLEYQHLFSKAGLFSPAFWFSDSAYLHVQTQGISENLRFYFVAGQHESSTMIPNMMLMYETLSTAGQEESEMYFISHTDGAHSEWYWAREYPSVYEWLFDEIVLSYPTPPNTTTTLSPYPNPVTTWLTVPDDLVGFHYTIYTLEGSSIQSGQLREAKVDTSGLQSGIYILSIIDLSGQSRYAARFVRH